MKKLLSVIAMVLLAAVLCSCSAADARLRDSLTETEWVMFKMTDGDMEFTSSTMDIFGYSGSLTFRSDGTYSLRIIEAETVGEEGVFSCSGKDSRAELSSESGVRTAVYEEGLLILSGSGAASGVSIWFAPEGSEIPEE